MPTTLLKTILAAVLFMTMCHANSFANDQARQRFDQVIAYVKDHPVAEAPIGTHPKKRDKPFSRIFNITLSARAYFQLHTDPSLDAASGRMLEKVAQYYLDHLDQMRDPDSAYWAGEYHAACLAKFGANGSERKGAIPRHSERVVLDYMLAYVNYWSRLKHYDFSLKHDTYYYWSTENHWWQEIVTAWGYLLVLKDDPDYAGRKLEDGKSLQEHYQANSAYIKQHMAQRARKGFLLEISSGGYATRMQNMWHVIYDISPDRNMRDLARNTLDLYWAFWAEEEISGERGGGKVRHRGLKGLSPHTEVVMLPAWMLFGIGQKDMDYIRNMKPHEHALASNYIVLFSGYFPDEVIYKIIEDRKSAPPYAIVQRRLGRIIENVEGAAAYGDKGSLFDVQHGDCLKYSWVTPNYVLGTVMRPPYHFSKWNRGSAQSWWHGLLIAGEGPSDPPDRVVPVMLTPRDSIGEQYAVQSKGSFMTRKLPDTVAPRLDNKKLPMGLFISAGLLAHTEHSDDFLFIGTPKCWVAVRAAGTKFVRNDQRLLEKHRKTGHFFELEDGLMPLIIETAAPGSYASFDAFKSAARQARLTSADGAHRYAALSGDQFTMFDDRSNPTIHGQPIDYNPPTAYRSRYIASRWDSGIVKINAGGAAKTLDFTLTP